VVLAVGLGVGGAGLAGYAGLTEREGPAWADGTGTPPRKIGKGNWQQKEAADRTDLLGDPLPEGAMARLGTERLRHPGVNWVCYAAGGKVLASNSATASFGICFWNAATGKLLHRLPGHWYPTPESMAVSPNGNLILADSKQPSLLDVGTGMDVGRFENPAGGVLRHAIFSPDGQTVGALVSVNEAMEVFFWDVDSGKVIRRLEGLPAQMTAFVFSPDLKVLAMARGEKSVHLLDVATGKKSLQLDAPERIHALAFAPSGKILAAATSPGGIALWDVQTGKQLHWLKQGQFVNGLTFSPDGKVLASTENDGRLVRLWDSATMREIRRLPAQTARVTSLAFSPDGKEIASVAQGSPMIRRWDAATGEEIVAPAGHTAPINSLMFAGDGKTLVSRAAESSNTEVQTWEWNLITSQARRQAKDEWSGPDADGWSWNVLDRSLDGRTIALVWHALREDEIDTIIRLWDPVLRKEIVALRGHRDWVRSGQFSPDGKFFASVSTDGTRLWDVGTGQELLHVEVANGLVFSADSRLAAYSGSGHIYLFDIAARKDRYRWQSDGLQLGLLFSPDGKLLACLGKSVSFRAVDTGKLVKSVPLQSPALVRQPMFSAFSPNSRTLAVGDLELQRPLNRILNRRTETHFVIRLWEVLSGEEIRHFDNPQREIASLAFSPDGRILASGGADTTILLWELTNQGKGSGLAPAPLAAEQLNALWSDLGDGAPQADRAIWRLAQVPQQSVPWLKQRLQIVATPAEQITKLIGKLDDKNFAVRQKASKALDDMGEVAEGALRKALEANPALEVRQRIEQILERRKGDMMRKLRAVDVLEIAGTGEARRMLESLAKEAADPRLAEAAATALKRKS
jgi:WD40 repeat protein